MTRAGTIHTACIATAAACADLVGWAEPRVRPLPGRRAEQGWSVDLDELHEVAGRALRYVTQVNARNWRWRLREIRFAVLRYEIGQRMARHVDPSPPGMVRRASVSVQLTPGDDYAGGDLTLWPDGRPIVASRDVGTAVAFPAATAHEVGEVTSGVRWALVGWSYS
ncbi:Prolyl 4-hydroxylase alpha subunit [Parafrankia sp. EAN1pec]|uniref:2OG-Fe(II) oxygenase n=1 Tax=Parafrankia sp. (strain EAN1pec) TaxID=298653 RepID=UPI0000542804|nr:Prolyl 4-hydroxylase alpha subunit [Frankia sp. EAN1pec]